MFLGMLVSASPGAASQRPLVLTFIDVGGGDSLLIQSPEGVSALVDTGNLISGAAVVKLLQSRGIGTLDSLILTHSHMDHIGGVFAVAQFINVLHIYDNDEDLTGGDLQKDTRRLYMKLVRQSPNYRALRKGDELKIGDAKLKVLWPPADRTSGDWNTNSLVILLEYGGFNALLMGDANRKTEKVLLDSTSLPSGIKLIKAGHHGAEDTARKSFLAKTGPRAVIISVEPESPSGYPSAKTIARYEKHGASVFRTDLSGHITVDAFPSGSFHVKYGKELEIF